jgi:hypothetical protein
MSVAYPTKLDLARDLIEYVDDHSNDVVGDREHVDTGGRGEGDAWVRSVRASSVTCECLVRSGADHLDVLETRKLLDRFELGWKTLVGREQELDAGGNLRRDVSIGVVMDGFERSAELVQAFWEDLHGDGNDEVREGHGVYEWCLWGWEGVRRSGEWTESIMDVGKSLVAHPRMFHDMNDARSGPDMLFLDRGVKRAASGAASG